MHVLCPHCRNPIELVRLTPHEQVSCPSCGSNFGFDAQTTAVTNTETRTHGRFILLETVGQGGFGTVYKARDGDLDRIVALKVPRSGNLSGPQELERFLREARSVAQLKHPSIVAIHEVGQVEGLPYLVSDFVTGVTLGDRLSAGRPSQRQAAEVLVKVAEAVQYAHEQGVIHRDLKPANIMLDEQSRPVVMDFGLARRDAGEITMTVDGQILGTPAYMSPEQARGEAHKVDGRSDVYSLGVILYELLTGELPFRGTKRMLLHQVLNDEPRPVRKVNDTVARDMETICLKAMAKEPGQRYGSAGELAADLRRWLNGEPILARPVGRLEHGWRWCARNPAVASLSAAVLLVLLAGTAISWGFAIEANHRADAEALAKETEKQAREAEFEAKKTALFNEANAKQANAALLKSTDELVTSVARSLLRPLTTQFHPYEPLPPLSDPEIGALWELASSKGDRLRLRFIEEALRDPVTTRQLKERAVVALHAAVGLQGSLRVQVEELLGKRLQAKAASQEEQVDVALCLAELPVLEQPLARRAAAALTQAIVGTSNVSDPTLLVKALAALAARLEAKEAATVCARASATLIQIMQRTVSPAALGPLAENVERLATRLETKEAAVVRARAITILTQAMDRTTNLSALGPLARGLSALATQLDTKKAATVCGQVAVVLTQAMNRTTDYLLRSQTDVLLEVITRLEAKEATSVCARAAAILTQAMPKMTDATQLSRLARRLSEVAEHLGTEAASAVRGQAVTILTQAMSKTTNSSELESLVSALSALAVRLEAREVAESVATVTQAISKTTSPFVLAALAESLSTLASRLAARDADMVCSRAVTILTQAMSKTSNPSELGVLVRALGALTALPEAKVGAKAAATLNEAVSKTTNVISLVYLARSLSAVAERLEAGEAGEAADTLTQAMSKTTNPFVLESLAESLSMLATRLAVREADVVCSRAVTFLTQAMGETTNLAGLGQLALRLSALATYLDSRKAATVCGQAAVVLTQAMSRATNPFALIAPAHGLAAVASRLEAKDAIAVCGRTAATLSQAMNRTVDSAELGALAESLSAVAARLEAREAAATLTSAMSKTTNPIPLVALARGLSAVAARLQATEARAVCTRGTAALRLSVRLTSDPAMLRYLALGLKALAARLEAKEAAATLIEPRSKTTNPDLLRTLAEDLSEILTGVERTNLRARQLSVATTVGILGGLGTQFTSIASVRLALPPVPPPLPAQTLVDILKGPCCVGEARRLVLAQLSRHYDRSFANQWEFVDYVNQHKLDLDLTSPPQRPTTVGSFVHEMN